MTTRLRLLALVAVVGGPAAWVCQLAFGYSFEETACSPGDGADVWGVGVRTWHVVVGAAALAVAVASLAAALALRGAASSRELDANDRSLLVAFGVLGASIFVLTIVLTGVGSIVLSTCHGG